MGQRMDMMGMGLKLVSHIEPILKEIVEIKVTPKHGKQELIEQNGKSFAIYREFFDNESDAKHFISFVNQIYAMQKGQLPPIHILVVLFKALLPIMQPKQIKGKQSHGQPEIRKMENGQFGVILKEVFTEKDDALNHLAESEEMKKMRL